MKIIIVGASGTVGSAIVSQLEPNHTIIKASRNGDVRVDLNAPESIEKMFNQVGPFDALICVSGGAKFGPLQALADADFEAGFQNKLMGQVHLVRFGAKQINDGGVFVLTSGKLSTHVNKNSVLLTTFNSAVEGFAKSAALSLDRGLRLNVVRTPMVRETAQKMGWGDGGVPVQEVAKLYIGALSGIGTGTVIEH